MQRLAPLGSVLASAAAVVLCKAFASRVVDGDARAHAVPVRLHPLEFYFDEVVRVPHIVAGPGEAECGGASGGRFLRVDIGNYLPVGVPGLGGGDEGGSPKSARLGYTVGFWALVVSGMLLVLIAPLINKLMNGVR